ncbi:hypothetical protein LX16_4928 [Stackebrandtia albiflava]|uniref:Uncharacterized protein n=1 Tax=Stackebrandtia albiflava TaxID=406432 RepID=A0A562UQ82_9ACTN|nr:hypothetical protein [Stackebrandtia albiflava]TWJ07766.1 hypothetical protein LX16_4928 [Stackebrandtia albiflava]
MDRARLSQLLVGDHEAYSMAVAALEAGAAFKVWDIGMPPKDLLAVLVNRERRARRSRQPTIGLSEAIAALREYSGAEVFLGFIDDRDRDGYRYQVVLDETSSRVICCVGVKFSDSGSMAHGQRSDLDE